MTHNQLEQYKNKMHHHAIFHMQDGSTVDGNMQPWDDDYVYVTIDNGAAGGQVKISDIQRIEFPDE